jgi:hypothetical protein
MRLAATHTNDISGVHLALARPIKLHRVVYLLHMLTSSLRLPIAVEQLRRILRRHGVRSASLFGSYARGDARPDSDLDLLVTYSPGTNLLRVLALQDELEAAAGTQVDLVSAKFIRKRLAASIKSDLIRIL